MNVFCNFFSIKIIEQAHEKFTLSKKRMGEEGRKGGGGEEEVMKSSELKVEK